MTAMEIFQVIELAEKLNLKVKIVIKTILGEGQYNVNYEYFKMDDNYLWYDKNYRVTIKDIKSVNIH